MSLDFEFKITPKAEGALPLPKSSGKPKSRVHLYDYQGVPGRDPTAIAAKAITPKKGSTPKLNPLERMFYVLCEDPSNEGTWYKINKRSLKKRLGISNDELKSALEKKPGNANALQKLIQDKFKSAIKNDPLLNLRNEKTLTEELVVQFSRNEYSKGSNVKNFNKRTEEERVFIRNALLEFHGLVEQIIQEKAELGSAWDPTESGVPKDNTYFTVTFNKNSDAPFFELKDHEILHKGENKNPMNGKVPYLLKNLLIGFIPASTGKDVLGLVGVREEKPSEILVLLKSITSRKDKQTLDFLNRGISGHIYAKDGATMGFDPEKRKFFTNKEDKK